MISLDFHIIILYNINNNININIVMDNDKEKDMIDVNNLLTQAISETTKLNVGEKFLVKDLFKGYEWNRIPRNTRLLLGTLFLNAVNNNANLKIQTIEKSSSNQQKYQKR